MIHSIIAFSVFEPERENEGVKTYKRLCNALHTDIMRGILMEENEQKLRPLEMTAQCGGIQVI